MIKVKMIRTLQNNGIEFSERCYNNKQQIESFIKNNPWWIILD